MLKIVKLSINTILDYFDLILVKIIKFSREQVFEYYDYLLLSLILQMLTILNFNIKNQSYWLRKSQNES